MPVTKYINDSLFNAPKGSILAHSCNALGIWGAGIAKEFKKRFPEAEREYHLLCEAIQYSGKGLQGGTYGFYKEKDFSILSLIVSNRYGKDKDKKWSILTNTQSALLGFMREHPELKDKPICIPKINSGLFEVPWEDTVRVVLDELPLEFHVYTGGNK